MPISLRNNGKITILCSYAYEMFNRATSYELSQSKAVALKDSGFSVAADAMCVAPAFLIRLIVKLKGAGATAQRSRGASVSEI